MLSIVENLHTPVSGFIANCSRSRGFFISLFTASTTSLLVLDFFSYLAGVVLFIEPVRIIVGKYADVKKLDVFLERTFSMLEIKPQIKDNPQQNSSTQITSSKIEFKNVEFSYNPEEEVIKGITFSIRKINLLWGLLGSQVLVSPL